MLTKGNFTMKIKLLAVLFAISMSAVAGSGNEKCTDSIVNVCVQSCNNMQLSSNNENSLYSKSLIIANSDIGQCMGDCASEQGICIGQCEGNGQCIGNCAAAHGRCVAKCH